MTGLCKKFLSFSAGSILCCFSHLAAAQPIKPEIDYKHDYLAEQRKLFSTAWYAAKEGHITLSQKIAPKIKDYPLYPDLEAEWLSYRPREERFAEALAFVKLHENTTAAYKVTKTWQYKAMVNQKWHWYEQLGEVNNLPTDSLCKFTLHLLNSKTRKEEGRELARDLWLTSASQPKQCDPVFNQLTKQGFIDQELIWQRAALAIFDGRKAMANYLMKSLNGDYLSFAQEIFNFKFSREQRIEDHQLANPKARLILKDIFILLARVDPHAAAERWLNFIATHPKSDSDDVRREIAKRIFLTNRTDTQLWLQRLNPIHLDEDITDWQLRFAVSNEDWDVISDLLSRVVNTHGFESLSERQRYWQARANQELGEYSQAQMQFKSLAVERSFYGFMSADISDLPYQLNNQPIEVDSVELENIVQHTSIRRIREWLLMGEDSRADLEWRLAQSVLTHRDKLAVAKLAQLIDEPNLAIRASISASYWNDIQLRFPLDYSSTIEKATKGMDINQSLVMSLTRQESAFNERARSPVGAMGLMQLMPATAKQVSKSIGMNFSKANLYDKETNLRLGSSYLDQLIDHYQGNAILATAAYNAGPNRVDQWLEETPNCQRVDTWIESIPYKETRNYVQNILAYKVIYDTLQGKPARLMAPGQEILGAAAQFSVND